MDGCRGAKAQEVQAWIEALPEARTKLSEQVQTAQEDTAYGGD